MTAIAAVTAIAAFAAVTARTAVTAIAAGTSIVAGAYLAIVMNYKTFFSALPGTAIAAVIAGLTGLRIPGRNIDQ